MIDFSNLFKLVADSSDDSQQAVIDFINQISHKDLNLDELSSKQQYGKNLLATAASEGSLETLLYLTNTLNITYPENTGHSLLYWLLLNPKLKNLSLLEAPLNTEKLHHLLTRSMTDLHIAALNEDEDTFEAILISESESPHQSLHALDENGFTPVFYISFRNNLTLFDLVKDSIDSQNHPDQMKSICRGLGLHFIHEAAELSLKNYADKDTIESYARAYELFDSLKTPGAEDYRHAMICCAQLAQAYLCVNEEHLLIKYALKGLELEKTLRSYHPSGELSPRDEKMAKRLHETLSSLQIKQTYPSAEETANPYGFATSSVLEDGACFFHAVAEQLGQCAGLSEFHITADALRQLACAHIKNYQTYYQPFLADNKTMDDYLTAASEKTYWADHPLIFALARSLPVSIFIITNLNNSVTICKQHHALHTIYLCNLENRHFESMHRNPDLIPTKSSDALIENEPYDNILPIDTCTSLSYKNFFTQKNILRERSSTINSEQYVFFPIESTSSSRTKTHTSSTDQSSSPNSVP